MKGIEVFNSSAAVTSPLTSTFKLDELAGTDCIQTIGTELDKLGKIGQVRADYTNKLIEVQRDTAVTDSQIIDALIKSNHPGKVTTDKIVVQPAESTATGQLK
jgi:copper chaperone CopZ